MPPDAPLRTDVLRALDTLLLRLTTIDDTIASLKKERLGVVAELEAAKATLMAAFQSEGTPMVPHSAFRNCLVCEESFIRTSNRSVVCPKCRKMSGVANVETLRIMRASRAHEHTCAVIDCGRTFTPVNARQRICGTCRTKYGDRMVDRINRSIESNKGRGPFPKPGRPAGAKNKPKVEAASAASLPATLRPDKRAPSAPAALKRKASAVPPTIVKAALDEDDVDVTVVVSAEALDALDAADPELVGSLSDPAPAPPKYRTGTRQLTEAADRAKATAGTSWWLDKDRHAFSKAAAEREPLIKGSTGALKVPDRIEP